MLPLSSKIAFIAFTLAMLALGGRGFYRAFLRIRRGAADTDKRWERWPVRLWYALSTTLSQRRTFRKRGVVSFFHSFIFYGFTFYLLVNLVDAIEGFIDPGRSAPARNDVLRSVVHSYEVLADVLSFLVMVGVIALVIRRFGMPARRDFRFNERTMVHKDVRVGYISRDSLIVSVFILFHVGSRAVGSSAKLVLRPEGYSYQPFAALISHAISPSSAYAWSVFGYWGALGSVLAFLAYFPYSKHMHIFAAPLKYFFARESGSGVLPRVEIDLEGDEQKIGAEKLEDLAWPRLLDAYACIQCNRCQDVCPATVTGKSLSPAALEINKRMELNDLGLQTGAASFTLGAASPHPLLSFALTPEAAWACTTCGACMEVCPVQDEQMLDIIDIRRNQVMIQGEFPTQLQTAFRGMERAKNPWGISHDKRMAWAEGLSVTTTDVKPDPDVLYWVGCAASYDPQAQKTARAVVQLLDHAGVDYAVLGKRECCTGDSARRGGNELLYRDLAGQNISTLNELKPKLVIASCPHCMNAIGNEYKQLGGDYAVMHHSEYLEKLVGAGKLTIERSEQSITYHDPCYLGRHNGVYDAPRNLLRVLGSEVLELERNRGNSFCCGAGGAQFWKEEEAGTERVSDNRFEEVQRVLGASTGQKTLAVGCPFCKSMLGSTPANQDAAIAIKDLAELLLEGVLKKNGLSPSPAKVTEVEEPRAVMASAAPLQQGAELPHVEQPQVEPIVHLSSDQAEAVAAPQRKKWQPKKAAQPEAAQPASLLETEEHATPGAPASEVQPFTQPVERKKWQPKSKS